MAEPDLVLEFQIEAGRNPDIEKVARALLAWNEAVQSAVRAIDPSAVAILELTGVEHGSQRFKQALRFLEDFAQQVEAGGSEFPLIYRSIKALAKLIASGILMAVILGEVIPDEQLEELQEIRKILESDADFRRKSEKFYENLQDESAISEVVLYEGSSKEPIYSVPRSEFFMKSGLFRVENDYNILDYEEQRVATWEVVLIKPVLVGKPRRWTFARDGVEFSATMNDQTVLAAIKDRSASIPFAEGVMMRVEVAYTEQFDGQVWRAIPRTRVVRKVLSPRIILPPGSLFSDSN